MTNKTVTSLRALADWVEAHPEVQFMLTEIMAYPVDTKENMQATARAMGSFDKTVSDTIYILSKPFGGIKLRMVFWRDQVCERIVLGRRTVTRMEPDPNAPRQSVTREEEVVEWRCPPLLSIEPGQDTQPVSVEPPIRREVNDDDMPF